jgi:hypothetical protein
MEVKLMADKQWPKDYPTHIQVPPKTAKPLSKNLFRMVENEPPILQDFVASNKDPLQAYLIKHSKFKNKAGFYGTSFFTDKQRLTDIIKGNPNKFRKKKVAFGSITLDMGVGEQDGQSHLSIWFYENIFPSGFEIV